MPAMVAARRLSIAFAAASCTLASSVAFAQTPTTNAAQAAAGSVSTTAPTTGTAATREAGAVSAKKPEPPFVPMVLTAPPAQRAAIVNDVLWHDTEGMHINAHGGGVLFHDGVYYWYGEQRNPRGERGSPSTEGVNCYTSTDLYNWTPAGIVMPVVADDEASDIARGCTIERPKVIYNALTKKFVMWFHLELKGRGYAAARTAVAVADAPTGPFRFIRSLRPNAGHWPINFPESMRTPLTPEQQKAEMAGDKWRSAMVAGAYLRRDFAGGQMARDMTLFVDDDGKAYHVASAEENYTLNIHELTDDYLDFTGKYLRVTPGGHNEAPAIVKHEGKYHMLASGCTGWAPNDARVLTADSMWGPWTRGGNPARGVNPQNGLGPGKTWGGQSTFILPVAGKPNAYVAMFDVWRPRSLIESGYIWLPVEFENGEMVIRWRDAWTLDVFK